MRSHLQISVMNSSMFWQESQHIDEFCLQIDACTSFNDSNVNRIISNLGGDFDKLVRQVYLCLLVLLIGLMTSGKLHADENAVSYGLGVRSCAQFGRDYATDPEASEETYFLWAEGFMSGLNLMAGTLNAPMREFTPGHSAKASYESYIRNYCNEHPLVPYHAAVTGLYNTLPPSIQKPH